MTSTASFKDKLNQILSVFLWELKACTGTLTVYSILAGVFTIVILTLSIVSPDYVSIMSGEDDFQLSHKIAGFQVTAATVVLILTIIFTIFYTIRVYSYMHDKRKADFYGPLPISRARMYLSKTLSAYVFSVVPALFFMSVIAIISVCTGTPIHSYVSGLFFNIIVGTLACVTAYGLVAICCGTTLNSVIMFLVVCLTYPVAMTLLMSIVSAFYPGFYMGTITNSFIPTALNPMAAYSGKNLIYWIIFSVLCVVGATVLIMKRKSERAQTSFAYYLPCYLVKLMVSFICGALLGCIFASVDVKGLGLVLFIFGFLLGSVPAYVITHLIFYKDFKKLLVSSIPLGAMIVFVIIGSSIFTFDLFGYNSYIPKAEDIRSVGYIDSEYYMPKDNKSIYEVSRKSSKDITDPELIADVISAHKYFAEYNDLGATTKFRNIWLSMIANVFGEWGDADAIVFNYKLDNGMTVSRYYRMDFSLFSEINEKYNYDMREKIQKEVAEVYSQKEYILKYSAIANADFTEEKEIERVEIFAFTDNDKNTVSEAEITAGSSYYNSYLGESEDTTSQEDLEKQMIMLQISQAFVKDLKTDETKYKTVLLDPYDNVFGMGDRYSSSMYDNYDDDTWLSVYDGTMLDYVRSNIDEDIVCQINISTRSQTGMFSTYNDMEETYYIPSSYTNTLEALRNYGIIDSDNNLNKYSDYANQTY
ncbi:MAG: ABC transporter permease [Ruminococcus sp.]|nr:ABC transporter permease [Ruminococcus sp.]